MLHTPNAHQQKTLSFADDIFTLEDEVCLSKTKSAPSVPEDSVSYQSNINSFSDCSTSSSFQKL